MTERPNLLFLFPDQHRADWVGWNAALPVRTPNLDALASRGMRFERAFTSSPLCAPARACLASGRGYGRCGVWNNHQDYPLELPTFYQSLREAGYRVAGVGKFDLHKNLETMNWNPDGSRDLDAWGFTEGIDNEGKLDARNSYVGNGRLPKGPYMRYLQEHGWADRFVEEQDATTEHSGAYTTRLPDEAYLDNWIAENGLRCLQTFPEGRPWFLMVNFAGPHGPFDVTESMRNSWANADLPPPHDAKSDEIVLRKRRHYAAMIENIDRHLGAYLAQLDARGERENTIIVYASDHGEMLGDHGMWGKCTPHHASTRVPLVVAGPGIQRGVVSRAMIQLHDLAATFVEAAGGSPPPGMDARSLWSLLSGDSQTHRDTVCSGLVDPRATPARDWDMVFDGRCKLVRDHADERLYDIDQDPYEERDVSAAHPDVVRRLEPRMRPRLPEPA